MRWSQALTLLRQGDTMWRFMTGNRTCPHCRVTWLVGLILCFGLATLATPAAQAQTSLGRLYDKWQLDLSGAVVIMGTTIRVDGAEGEGTDVKSDDLGLPGSRFMPRASVRWRPGQRHELELGYQFARRSAERAGAKVAMLPGLGHWWMCQDPKKGAETISEFIATLD